MSKWSCPTWKTAPQLNKQACKLFEVFFLNNPCELPFSCLFFFSILTLVGNVQLQPIMSADQYTANVLYQYINIAVVHGKFSITSILFPIFLLCTISIQDMCDHELHNFLFFVPLCVTLLFLVLSAIYTSQLYKWLTTFFLT